MTLSEGWLFMRKVSLVISFFIVVVGCGTNATNPIINANSNIITGKFIDCKRTPEVRHAGGSTGDSVWYQSDGYIIEWDIDARAGIMQVKFQDSTTFYSVDKMPRGIRVETAWDYKNRSVTINNANYGVIKNSEYQIILW